MVPINTIKSNKRISKRITTLNKNHVTENLKANNMQKALSLY